jgi:hypothetical protein
MPAVLHNWIYIGSNAYAEYPFVPWLGRSIYRRTVDGRDHRFRSSASVRRTGLGHTMRRSTLTCPPAYKPLTGMRTPAVGQATSPDALTRGD